MDLKKAEKKLGIKKAEVNVAELEFKILERQADIARIQTHIEKQEKLIVKLSSELAEGE